MPGRTWPASGSRPDTPLTVVAIDRSFSLSAPGVFDRARALAAEAVNEAPASHAVALVAFDEAAETIVEPTTDRGAVTAAIRATAPASPAPATRPRWRAPPKCSGRATGRVVVVTDLQQAGWQGPPRGGLADDVEVIVKRVEASLQNLAVDRRRSGEAAASRPRSATSASSRARRR